MRLTALLAFVFFLFNLISAQTSLNGIDLKPGKYKVGFRHYIASDSTRTYKRIYDYNNEVFFRPIPISIWYPTEHNIGNQKPLQVIDYLEILKEEEEWEHLPNDQILNWFYYANTSANQKQLEEKTSAYLETEFTEDKHAVVIYTPSYQASSIENFALCEYLASHGYIVISSPSRGTETRWFSENNAKEMETQARDVEFLIKEAGRFPNVDYQKFVLMGFSFGGLSNIIVQNRNHNVEAVVSLDGTERYQYTTLNESPFFDVEKIDVPYLHMAQKDIPESVLKQDNIAAELNFEFKLYDSLSKSKAYQLKFNDLTHSYFSTLGVLFANRDIRQDKSDAEIMKSYKLVSTYTLNFINAFFLNDEKALAFITNKPIENGIAYALITQKPRTR